MNFNVFRHSLFPTSISVYRLQFNLDENKLKSLIDQETTQSNGLITQGVRSKSNNILDKNDFVMLKNNIQDCVYDYCSYTGISPCFITKSWACIYEEFGNIKSHRHELSLVSGVYYLEANDLSGFFGVENPTQIYKINEVSDHTTEFTQHRYHFPVEKNCLILFPSWLYHFTEANFSKKIAISFDCRLKEHA